MKIDYRRSAQVYTEVLDGDADLGLVAFPTKRTGLVIEDFWRDKLVLICHPAHPLAERQRVRLRDLQGEKFISFEPDLPTRKVIDRLLREQGVEIEHTMEFDNIETVKRAVEIENGISIVPQTSVADETRNGSLVAIEVESFDMWRPLGVVYRRHRVISPAQKAVRQPAQGTALAGGRGARGQTLRHYSWGSRGRRGLGAQMSGCPARNDAARSCGRWFLLP